MTKLHVTTEKMWRWKYGRRGREEEKKSKGKKEKWKSLVYVMKCGVSTNLHSDCQTLWDFDSVVPDYPDPMCVSVCVC